MSEENAFQQIYDKVKQLTNLCDREFKEIHHRLDRIETKIDVLGKRLLEVETTLELHDRRITSLEDRT